MKVITLSLTPFTLRVHHTGNEMFWDISNIEIYARPTCDLPSLVGDDVHLEQFDARGQALIVDAMNQAMREQRLNEADRRADAKREVTT